MSSLYRLRLWRAAARGPSAEPLDARSEPEAVELARLRFLLGGEFQRVELWRADERLAVFDRDTAAPPASDGA